MLFWGCLLQRRLAPDIASRTVCAAIVRVVFGADGTVVQIGLDRFGKVLVASVHENVSQLRIRADVG